MARFSTFQLINRLKKIHKRVRPAVQLWRLTRVVTILLNMYTLF